MTEKKRFTLQSIKFNKLTVELFDNLKAEHLELSIYELIELLNTVSKQEYGLKNLRDDIIQKLDEIDGDVE